MRRCGNRKFRDFFTNNDIGLFGKMERPGDSFSPAACSKKTYAEIAKEMFVSDRTVDRYRDSLFKKLNTGSRVGRYLRIEKWGR